MTSSNLQVWFYAELTLKAKADGTSKTVYLSNRAIIDDTNKGRYVPILRGISGIGNVAGRYLPEPTRGAIEIDNSPGSYGHQRKFSDLFERYTLITQTIKIYSAVTDYEDLDVSGNFSLQWQGIVSRYRIDGDRLRIEVASDIIPRRVITKAITPGAFPNAPAKSLGKHLPMVFGVGVQCEAIQIAADADSSPEFAYATTLSTKYPVGGVAGYFAKDRDGKYQQVSSAGAVGTILYGNTQVSGKTNAPWATSTTEYGKRFTVTTSYILSNAYIRLYKRVGTDTGGILTVRLRKADLSQTASPTSAPGTILATCIYDTSTLANAAGEYDLSLGFSEAIVLEAGQHYYLTFNYQTSGAGLMDFYYDGGLSESNSVRNQGLYWELGTVAFWALTWYWGVFGVVFTDTKSSAGDSDGLGYAQFELTQSSTPTVKPDLTKLSLLVSVNGLTDDSSGTITGGANLTLTGPAYVIRCLDKEWNGSTWTGGKLDWNEQSDSRTYVTQVTTGHYHRQIGGKTEGQTFLDQIYERICRQHGMRMYLFNGGASSLALYAWGTNRTTPAVIGDDDATIDSVDFLGVESVINRIIMYYDKRIIAADAASAAAQGAFQNYAKTLDWLYSTDTWTALISTLSETLYGRRELNDRVFDLINDDDSAEAVAKFLASVYREPWVFTTFRVPFFKYNSLDLFDVVELVHPGMPSHFGTTADANLPTYGGADCDILQGHHLKRAKRYRVQIEGKEVNWNLGGFPELKITARVLNNAVDPT